MTAMTMTTASAAALSGGSASYSHPRLFRSLALFGIAFSVVGLAFVLSLPFLEPEADHMLIMICLLPIFAVGLVLGIAMARSSRDTVVVADDGLWYHSPGGPSLFIRWNEITGVQPQNVMQRLLVTDSTGSRRIYLEYQLERFGELRRIVLDRATRRTVDRV
jgi:hypothetical protein